MAKYAITKPTLRNVTRLVACSHEDSSSSPMANNSNPKKYVLSNHIADEREGAGNCIVLSLTVFSSNIQKCLSSSSNFMGFLPSKKCLYLKQILK